MTEHRIVLDGSTHHQGDDWKRQRAHCTGCDLTINVTIRPAAAMDAFIATVREAHEGDHHAD